MRSVKKGVLKNDWSNNTNHGNFRLKFPVVSRYFLLQHYIRGEESQQGKSSKKLTSNSFPSIITATFNQKLICHNFDIEGLYFMHGLFLKAWFFWPDYWSTAQHFISFMNKSQLRLYLFEHTIMITKKVMRNDWKNLKNRKNSQTRQRLECLKRRTVKW